MHTHGPGRNRVGAEAATATGMHTICGLPDGSTDRWTAAAGRQVLSCPTWQHWELWTHLPSVRLCPLNASACLSLSFCSSECDGSIPKLEEFLTRLLLQKWIRPQLSYCSSRVMKISFNHHLNVAMNNPDLLAKGAQEFRQNFGIINNRARNPFSCNLYFHFWQMVKCNKRSVSMV